jgi:hypothetical protein
MSLHDTVNDRIASSAWGRWLDVADESAQELASGSGSLKKISRETKRELPAEVIALLAITDLRDIVLELATAIDELRPPCD